MGETSVRVPSITAYAARRGSASVEQRASQGGVAVVKIGEARKDLTRMVESLESGSARSYVVGRYGVPAVAIVSYERFEPILGEGTKNEKLAFLVVEQFLPDAPQHLRAPAIAELSQLPMEDLITLWSVDALPFDDREAAVLRRKLSHPEIFERLRQRASITAALSEARSAGLYEAAEDLSSRAAESGGVDQE